MNIKINIIEVASELAEMELLENWQDSLLIYQEAENGDTYYTDEAQDIFNDLYDKYFNFLYDMQEPVSISIG
jgi:hypothetical protein